MSDFPSVAVVILNWNGKDYMEKFLPEVVRSSYPNLRVIVADNASTDQSVPFLRTSFPNVEILINNSNEGFAAGYNTALAQIQSDYFVLLNSDVEVTSGWIEPVITLMERDPMVAAAQPKIKSYLNKDRFEHAGAAGGYLDRFGYTFCRGRIFDTVEDDQGQYESASEIFWASGAAFFIKSSYWNLLGGFDADFYAHMEEIDLCWRLKNKGYKIMYCPQSTVYHIGGGTLQTESPFKTYLNFRNNLVLLTKNLDPQKRLYILFIRFGLDFISLLKFVANGKFQHALAISKAHRSFFKNLQRNWSKGTQDVSSFNKTGFYTGSIVWQYFVKGRKYFKDLMQYP
ncbi:Glycosyltransferase [Arcticibacter svalbardensis MN12-7]|uniref:Glycosyltransferase n=1 Tax=Arcticibacter svalbardensis MN12-7 TaxID=1150600 RepID=R9GV20_9SPHI|nr:glycosyltransferase family 2 protein [Arcticibacter svalbardensis]EOR95667.1 Glycosyltransferase [Arcticibacter svalbardensis MN12-7]